MSTREIEVINLTGDTDPEGSVVGGEDSTIRQAESLPALEEAPTLLTLIELGFSPSQQQCVHSLGPFKKPLPYWVATGLPQKINSLLGQHHTAGIMKRKRSSRKVRQPLEFGSCSDLKA